MQDRIQKIIFQVPLCLLIWIISILGMICVPASFAQEEIKTAKIGVLTQHGPGKCLAKWGPTAEYLSEKIEGWSFTIEPLTSEQVHHAVENRDIDFVLATSSLYVELEVFHNAGRIATLRNTYPKGTHTYFGGVLFCKSDRDDIRILNDIKGKSLIGLHEDACTAWHAVCLELVNNKIDPIRDFGSIQFGGSHPAIVEAVRKDQIDIGAVRSDTFERMQATGKIKPGEFRVIHELKQEHDDVPFSHSTPMFPEKPIAKLRHTPDELAEKVSAALIEMSPDSAAAKAAECGGWTIPLNYQSVHDCLKVLRITPYEDYGKVTLASVFRQYKPWIFTITTLIILIVGFGIFIVILKHRLGSAQKVILEHQIMEISDRSHRKFSQNLHDSLGQQLTGIRFMVEILKDKLETKSSEESGAAQKISDQVRKAMSQARDLAKELDPVELSENNLISAIEVLLRNIKNTFDVPCDFEYDESVKLDHSTQSVHLYRITQEAINNALKHGKANQILIQLKDVDGKYVLSVEDNGKGFSEKDTQSKGMGLHIMRYRANALNGTLDIKKGQKGGIIVICALPKTA